MFLAHPGKSQDIPRSDRSGNNTNIIANLMVYSSVSRNKTQDTLLEAATHPQSRGSNPPFFGAGIKAADLEMSMQVGHLQLSFDC